MVTVSGNTFTDKGAHASFTQNTASNLDVRVLSPTGRDAVPMTGSILQAVNVFSPSQSTGGTIVGTISGNFIGNASVPGSGSTQGGGVSSVIQGQTDATLLIDGNTIRQTSGDARAIGVAFRGPSNPLAGTLGPNTVISDLTITEQLGHTRNCTIGFPSLRSLSKRTIETGADNKARLCV